MKLSRIAVAILLATTLFFAVAIIIDADTPPPEIGWGTNDSVVSKSFYTDTFDIPGARFPWKTFEPTDDAFTWTALDTFLDLARTKDPQRPVLVNLRFKGLQVGRIKEEDADHASYDGKEDATPDWVIAGGSIYDPLDRGQYPSSGGTGCATWDSQYAIWNQAQYRYMLNITDSDVKLEISEIITKFVEHLDTYADTYDYSRIIILVAQGIDGEMRPEVNNRRTWVCPDDSLTYYIADGCTGDGVCGSTSSSWGCGYVSCDENEYAVKLGSGATAHANWVDFGEFIADSFEMATQIYAPEHDFIKLFSVSTALDPSLTTSRSDRVDVWEYIEAQVYENWGLYSAGLAAGKTNLYVGTDHNAFDDPLTGSEQEVYDLLRNECEDVPCYLEHGDWDSSFDNQEWMNRNRMFAMLWQQGRGFQSLRVLLSKDWQPDARDYLLRYANKDGTNTPDAWVVLRQDRWQRGSGAAETQAAENYSFYLYQYNHPVTATYTMAPNWDSCLPASGSITCDDSTENYRDVWNRKLVVGNRGYFRVDASYDTGVQDGARIRISIRTESGSNTGLYIGYLNSGGSTTEIGPFTVDKAWAAGDDDIETETIDVDLTDNAAWKFSSGGVDKYMHFYIRNGGASDVLVHRVVFQRDWRGTVSGYAFEDQNGNRRWDPGTDTPLSGAVFSLKDVDGNLLDQATTGGDGVYSFALLSDEYIIEEATIPATCSIEGTSKVGFFLLENTAFTMDVSHNCSGGFAMTWLAVLLALIVGGAAAVVGVLRKRR